MKKAFWIVLNITISGFFVWLATRGIDWAQLGESFFTVSVTMVILSVVINLVSCWLRAVRWKYLVAPIKELKTRNLFSALMLGIMVNNILPFRLGELVRGYVLKRNHQVPFSASMATVVVERVVDVISLLTIFAILILIFPFPEWIKTGGLIVGLIDVGFMIFLFLLGKRSEQVRGALAKVIRPISVGVSEKIDRLVASFASGIRFSGSWMTNLWMVALSFMIWICYILAFWVMFGAYQYPEIRGLGITDATVAMTFTSFAIMIPSAPGYVGTFHEVAKQSLMMLHVDKDLALGFAILFHAVHYLAQTATGLIIYLTENLNLEEALHTNDQI